MDRVDKIKSKAAKGKKLTIDEFKALQLDCASWIRNDFFPDFVATHGLPDDIKLTEMVWEAIWGAAMKEYNVVSRGIMSVQKAVIIREDVKAPKSIFRYKSTKHLQS
jgi:hypothetical protein